MKWMQWRKNLQPDNPKTCEKWYENITKPVLCWVGQFGLYDDADGDISFIQEKDKKHTEVIARYNPTLPSGHPDYWCFEASNGLTYSKAMPLTTEELNEIKTKLKRFLQK